MVPSGTVTFLFTDIEDSTALWDRFPRLMDNALARHDKLLRTAFGDWRGYVFATSGDGFGVAFGSATDAVNAAVGAAQQALTVEPRNAGGLIVTSGISPQGTTAKKSDCSASRRPD